MLIESHGGAHRRSVTFRKLLRLELPFAGRRVPRRLARLKLGAASGPAASKRESPWSEEFKVEKGDHATSVALKERAQRRIDAGLDSDDESGDEEDEHAATMRKEGEEGNSPHQTRPESEKENTLGVKASPSRGKGKRRRRRSSNGKGKGKGKGGGGELGDHDASVPPCPPDVLRRA